MSVRIRAIERRLDQTEVTEKPAGAGLYWFIDVNRSIPNSAWTAIVWNNNPLYTPPSPYSMDLATGALTFTTDGDFAMAARVAWAANAVGQRAVRITLTLSGGGTRLIGHDRRDATAAGDSIVVEAWQNSGGALNALKPEGYTNLFVWRIG